MSACFCLLLTTGQDRLVTEEVGGNFRRKRRTSCQGNGSLDKQGRKERTRSSRSASLTLDDDDRRRMEWSRSVHLSAMATGQRLLVHDMMARGSFPAPSKAESPPRKFGRLMLIPSRWPLMRLFQKIHRRFRCDGIRTDFLVLISELIQLLLRVSAAE